MTSPSNRREFTRVQVNLEAELMCGGKVVLKGPFRNISFNGILIQCDADLPMGTECHVGLVLDGGDGGVYVQAHGNVVRVDSSGIAVQFTELLGEESATHLRNLVLYNSHEQRDAVEQEFLSHIGLKPRD